MIALVCDTPYQLVSAIFLANSISRGEKLVLFLNQLWDKTARKFDIGAQDSRIHKIYYYGQEQMGMGMLVSGLFNPLGMLGRLDGFDADMEITHIITSRTTWIATYLYYYFKKKNPGLKMFMIEEGAGEYMALMYNTRFTRACRMLFKKTHCDYIDAAYFSAPELYKHKTKFPVYKLPCSPEDTESLRLIDTVFDAQNELEKLTPYRYIVLDEAFHLDDRLFNCTQDTILEWLEETVDPGGVVVKMHPRTDSLQAGKIAAVYSKAPFEILPAHTDTTGKVLISGISTAMLTSKFLYDQEPYLIFTYNLLHETLETAIPDREWLANVIRLMEDTRNMYRNKNKTFAPRTQKEFKEALAQIEAELKQTP